MSEDDFRMRGENFGSYEGLTRGTYDALAKKGTDIEYSEAIPVEMQESM